MPINVAILTISDAASRGEREDLSGANIERMTKDAGCVILERAVVPDERVLIARCLTEWADSGAIDLIVTTGGTGLAPRDVTPEATRDVIEREAQGLAEWMRMESVKLNRHAVLSRAVVGIRGKTLIVNLPGSPKGVVEMLELFLPLLPHTIDIVKGFPGDHTPPAG